MLLIAIKNLWQEKTKFLLSVGGVAFSIVLMIVMFGIYRGFGAQFVINITKNPSDIFVVQNGISDFFHGVSIIPETVKPTIEEVSGVREVVPLVGSRAIVKINDTKTDFFIYSFIEDSELGRPWNIIKGDPALNEKEIIVDERFTKKYGLKIGDTISPNDTEFTIAGITRDAHMIMSTLAFIRLEDAKSLSRLRGSVNFYQVALEEGANSDEVIDEIKSRVDGVDVISKERFVDNNLVEIEEGYLPIIWSMAVIAFVVGLVITALTVYTATIDKAREYGILKAIGIKDWQLFEVVLYQSLVSSLVGLVIGTVLSQGINWYLYEWMGLKAVTSMGDLVNVVGAVVVMSVLATFIPLKRIVSIDPAEVFKQ